MKKLIVPCLTLLTLFGGISAVFAESAPKKPHYITYQVEIFVDGERQVKRVPVHCPEASLVGLSTSSLDTSDEVVVKIRPQRTQSGYLFSGYFEANNKGVSGPEAEFSEIVPLNEEGRLHYDYNGKTYDVVVKPVK